MKEYLAEFHPDFVGLTGSYLSDNVPQLFGRI